VVEVVWEGPIQQAQRPAATSIIAVAEACIDGHRAWLINGVAWSSIKAVPPQPVMLKAPSFLT
jgi:hypothetical protein